MIFRSLILYFICFFPFVLFAQKQDNVWTFGYHNGLDFNAGEPVFIESASSMWVTAASISDKNGQLLFYSDGLNIYNAHNTVIANGDLMPFSASSVTGIKLLILQSLSNDQQYYLFKNRKGKLDYSLVDMSLNGGNGEVIQKEIQLADNINDIIITKGKDCFNYWLITQLDLNNSYASYPINEKGIQTPIESNGTDNKLQHHKPMLITPDSSHLITVKGGEGSSILGYEIFYFNKNTGKLDFQYFIEDKYYTEGYKYNVNSMCFSPNGRFLYVSITFYDIPNIRSSQKLLLQYDFSLLPDMSAFINSKKLIDDNPFSFNKQMRLAPNGKIYLSSGGFHGGSRYDFSNEYLSCIHQPNEEGVNCDYEEVAMLFPAYTEFPAFTLNSLVPPLGFYGANLPDEIIVQNHQTSQTAPQFNFLCPQVGKTISYADDAYDKIVWFDDTEGDTYHFSIPGIYWVYKFKDCHLTIDTLVMETSEMHLEEHYLNLCRIAHPTYDLKVQTNLPGTITWSTGAVDTTTITVTESGRYVVTFQNECGVFRDTAIVQFMEDCDCKPFIPNAFSPNGDGLNDVFQVKNVCPTEKFELYIYNRVGQRVFKSYSIQDTWDGSYNGKPLPNETYFYYLNYESVNGLQYQLRGDILLLR